jgi:GDP-4-dehydro-6-deoxy-D-mannose reductase
MRPVLVTGASGFAGSHLVDQLADAGEAVVAWQRPGGLPPGSRSGVTWESIDLLDKSQVRGAVARLQPRHVFHCAGAAHVGMSWTTTEPTFAVNVRGTHYLVEALRQLDSPTRLLIPSSAQVYAASDEPLREDHPLRPASPYGLSKLAQEMVGLIAPEPVQTIVARAFNHFGPRQAPSFAASDFARRIADIEAGRWGPEIMVGNLDARRDLTDVRDVVRAYRLMVDGAAPGAVYNVCSGRAVAIGDVLELLLRRSKVPIRVNVDRARYRPNDQATVVGNAERIASELGWTPTIPIEQTLDDLLAYWRGSHPSAAN